MRFLVAGSIPDIAEAEFSPVSAYYMLKYMNLYSELWKISEERSLAEAQHTYGSATILLQ